MRRGYRQKSHQWGKYFGQRQVEAYVLTTENGGCYNHRVGVHNERADFLCKTLFCKTLVCVTLRDITRKLERRPVKGESKGCGICVTRVEGT